LHVQSVNKETTRQRKTRRILLTGWNSVSTANSAGSIPLIKRRNSKVTAMAEKEKKSFGSKFTGFFKGIAQELKKVTWPTGKQLFRSTVTVLVVCAIVAIIISLFDWGLSSLIKLLVKG